MQTANSTKATHERTGAIQCEDLTESTNVTYTYKTVASHSDDI